MDDGECIKKLERQLANLLGFKDCVRRLLKTPRLTPATLKIRLARALRDVETPEPTIISTLEKTSLFDSSRKARRPR
jgi:hypothetical protein